MVEKEPRVEVVGEIHLEEEASLGDRANHPPAREALVLRRPPLPLPHLQEYVLRLDTQYFGSNREHVFETALCLLRIDVGGRRVLAAREEPAPSDPHSRHPARAGQELGALGAHVEQGGGFCSAHGVHKYLNAPAKVR